MMNVLNCMPYVNQRIRVLSGLRAVLAILALRAISILRTLRTLHALMLFFTLNKNTVRFQSYKLLVTSISFDFLQLLSCVLEIILGKVMISSDTFRSFKSYQISFKPLPVKKRLFYCKFSQCILQTLSRNRNISSNVKNVKGYFVFGFLFVLLFFLTFITDVFLT